MTTPKSSLFRTSYNYFDIFKNDNESDNYRNILVANNLLIPFSFL